MAVQTPYVSSWLLLQAAPCPQKGPATLCRGEGATREGSGASLAELDIKPALPCYPSLQTHQLGAPCTAQKECGDSWRGFEQGQEGNSDQVRHGRNERKGIQASDPC